MGPRHGGDDALLQPPAPGGGKLVGRRLYRRVRHVKRREGGRGGRQRKQNRRGLLYRRGRRLTPLRQTPAWPKRAAPGEKCKPEGG